MPLSDAGGDYTEGEVLWLLSLTVEEARYLGEDTSLRWWDVHNAHRVLRLQVRRAQLYALGHTHREIAAIDGVSFQAVDQQVGRVASRIAGFLNIPVDKAA